MRRNCQIECIMEGSGACIGIWFMKTLSQFFFIWNTRMQKIEIKTYLFCKNRAYSAIEGFLL